MCPLMDEWINKIQYKIYNEILFSLKKNELLTSATMGINNEDIILSETS